VDLDKIRKGVTLQERLKLIVTGLHTIILVYFRVCVLSLLLLISLLCSVHYLYFLDHIYNHFVTAQKP